MIKVLLAGIFITLLVIVIQRVPKNNRDEKIQPLIKPLPTLAPAEYSAWLPWWEEERFLAADSENTPKLEAVMPVWYSVSEDGEIIEINSRFKEEVVERLNMKGIKIIPSVSNADENGFDPERISLILNDDSLKNKAISRLVSTAIEKKYDGWDLDWEQIYAEDKDKFSDYIRDLSAALTEADIELSVTVHAKKGQPDDWDGTFGQDWELISKNADEIRIMAYDFHESGSAPGPVTPAKDLKETIGYAVRVIPVEKIVLGIPTYGYDWDNKSGKSYNYADMIKHLTQNDIQWKRDPNSKALYTKYTKNSINHTVWFEDAESFAFKKTLAQDYGIFKFSFWHLGGEDPRIWNK